MGSSTHWNAWIVQDENVKTHIDPALALICESLTHDYLWPILEEAGIEDFDSYAIWWDTTPLTLRPDRSREAIELYDRGEITGLALRRETGFNDEDAPVDDVDPIVQQALKLVQSSPALLVDPGLANIIAQLRDASAEGGGAIGDQTLPDADLPAEGMPDTDTLEDPEAPLLAATDKPKVTDADGNS